MARIANVEDLRRILRAPRPSTMAKVLTDLDEQAVAFAGRCPFVLMATKGEDGTIEVSPKGDEPGFVRVEDSRTLLMPERIGNNLAFGLQNIIANGQVGLIFLVPQTGETLRVSGRAEILDDAELLERLGSKGRPALLAIRIHIVRCYFHCARSVLRAQLWKPDSWPAPARVSFGRVIAPRVGGDEKVANQIDEYVATAYTKNLWSSG